jgi:hypothetical protein
VLKNLNQFPKALAFGLCVWFSKRSINMAFINFILSQPAIIYWTHEGKLELSFIGGVINQFVEGIKPLGLIPDSLYINPWNRPYGLFHVNIFRTMKARAFIVRVHNLLDHALGITGSPILWTSYIL